MPSYNNALDNEVVHTREAGDVDEPFIEGMERALQRAKEGKCIAGAVVFCERDGAQERVDVMYLGDRNAFAQVMFGCLLVNRMIMTNDNVYIKHDDVLERAKF